MHQMTFTSCRRKYTSAWDFVFPSDIFFLKYALALSLPVGDICVRAMRWKALFRRRLPDRDLRYRCFLPEPYSRGAHPAYFASAPGERKRLKIGRASCRERV